MAPWNGTLAIPALGVELPMEMAPTSDEQKSKASFKLWCKEHGSLVEQALYCAESGHEASRDSLARAVLIGKTAVVFEAEEIKALEAPGTPQRVEILETRGVFDFDPRYVVQSYHCWTQAPFEQRFASLWSAMDSSALDGVGLMMMSGRQYRVLLHAHGRKEFTLYRLRWEEEMRDGVKITEKKADSQEMREFRSIMETMKRPGSQPMLPGYVNPYVSQINKMIENKQKQFFASREKTA